MGSRQPMAIPETHAVLDDNDDDGGLGSSMNECHTLMVDCATVMVASCVLT